MALEQAAPSCWVCLMGCVFPEDMCHRTVDDRTRFYCSKECMWLDESNPGRYVGDRNFFDRYHGWELSELVRDLGFVRADGKTLIAQPHLENDNMWTLDDVKSMDFHVQSPNITVAEKLGLPNGSSVGLVIAERSHRRRAEGGGAVVERQRQRQRAGRRPEVAHCTVSPRVVFEPIGEEIDCDEEESVLDAAFRHGYNLVYGCREGQCSACKAYLLEGEVVLKPYSTFALSESEESNGYTLLCRAMPEEDLVVELLHFDPDNYKLEHEIRDGRGTVTAVEALTHDIRRLGAGGDRAGRLRLPPGPVRGRLDPRRPRRAPVVLDGEPARRRAHRADREALSQAGGSRACSTARSSAGDELRFTGPYGAFHLRDSDRPILMVAGGSGMAPILSLLRSLAEQGSDRTVRFFYGARVRAGPVLRRPRSGARGTACPTSSSCP